MERNLSDNISFISDDHLVMEDKLRKNEGLAQLNELLEEVTVFVMKEYVAHMSPKIVGGYDANISEWPFVAFMVYSVDDRMLTGCGASLVSSQTVLTAAHCLDDVTNYKKDWDRLTLTVLMGHSNIYKSTVLRQVIDYQTYYNYSIESAFGDIGVAFLDKPVIFSRTVKKVLLKSTPIDYIRDKQLLVAGWGLWSNQKERSHSASEKLQFLHQTLIPRTKCLTWLPDLEEGAICAGRFNYTRYVFSGDSGGPLVSKDNVQIGLVSYKLEGKDGVTVYTGIPTFIEWIRQAHTRMFAKNCGKHKINKMLSRT